MIIIIMVTSCYSKNRSWKWEYLSEQIVPLKFEEQEQIDTFVKNEQLKHLNSKAMFTQAIFTGDYRTVQHVARPTKQ